MTGALLASRGMETGCTELCCACTPTCMRTLYGAHSTPAVLIGPVSR